MADTTNPTPMSPSMKGMIRVKTVATDAEIPAVLATGRFTLSEESKCLFIGTSEGNLCVNDPDEIEAIRQMSESEAILRAQQIGTLQSALDANSAGDALNAQNDARVDAEHDAAEAQLRTDLNANRDADAQTKSTQAATDAAQNKAQSDETTRATTAEGNETNARKSADAQLAAADTTEAQTRQSFDQQLATADANEANLRNQGDQANAALIQKNSTDDQAFRTAQNARDLQQEQTEQLLGQALAILQNKTARVIDLMFAFAYTPLLTANVGQTLTITFPRAVLDQTWNIDFYSIGGVALGSITYTETLSARTNKVATVVLKSTVAVAVTGQVLAVATLKGS